jgi:hypothetical protein
MRVPRKRVPSRFSKTDVEHRRQFALKLFEASATLEMFIDAFKTKLHLGPATARKYYLMVRGEAGEEFQAMRLTFKAEQISVLRAITARAITQKQYSAAVGAQRLLAQIMGTLAPVRLEISTGDVQRDAMVTIVSNVSDEEMDQLVGEQAEFERRARAALPVKGDP